jgi:hypothetical protein
VAVDLPEALGETLKPIQTAAHDLGIWRSALYLVLQAQEHRRKLFLLVAVEVEMGEGFGVLVHEEIEIEEGLHNSIMG